MFGRRPSNDFDGLFVKQTHEELEPQEVLFSRIAHEDDSSEEQEESKLETPVSRWSVSLLYLLFAFAVFGFLGKTVYLQIFIGEDMVVKAQENAIRREFIPYGGEVRLLFNSLGPDIPPSVDRERDEYGHKHCQPLQCSRLQPFGRHSLSL